VESVLITVPVRAQSDGEIDALLQTLVSLRATAPAATVLVVDDHSPDAQARMIALAAAELECAYVTLQDAEGRSAALNVGLTAAAGHGMDTCLVSAGLVLDSPGWLDRLNRRTGTDGVPAAVAGGAVVEPHGLIRQAGYFFSLFRRGWAIRLSAVPQELLDVTPPLLCPVDSDVQLVRREWVERAGLYDEMMDGPYAALDFCLRVSAAGGECIFEPSVRGRALSAIDLELDDYTSSARRLRHKHAGMSFKKWVPEVI
jgi:glycosyltransferase involved in cell wall biosynthesis